jgi:uncharacterized protein (DUF2164 family)
MPTPPIDLTPEEKQHIRERIASYLRSERDEEWGELAVHLLADHLAEQIGPVFYNKGIDVAIKGAREQADRLEVNLDALKRMPPPWPPPGKR